MPKILMQSVKGHRYAGKWHEPGSRYSAEGESHARLMEALRHAVRVQEPAQQPEAVAPAPAARGIYRRRDITAEQPDPAPARKTPAAKKTAKSYFRRSTEGDGA